MISKYLKYSFILVLFLFNCKRKRECKGLPYGEGIEKEYILGDCYDIKKYPDYGNVDFIFKDTISFIGFLKNISINYIPNNYCLADSAKCDIDFSKYMLLGKFSNAGGCSIYYYRKFLVDAEKKAAYYHITVCDRGFCSKYGGSYNWVLVPKIPYDFEIKIIKQDLI